ncbi:MFS transporter [Orbus sturtevantii]|uniref:MFS transporter n=1 Tax=Orbus sturtevantii TaxID=3074109 RepID=UPI00370D36A9
MSILTSPKIKKIQRITLIFLIIAGIINYLDRSALSIANSAISGELGLTQIQMGYLLSAFSLSYAFAQLPVGIILDKIGSRITLGAGLLFWSIAQVACGLVHSFHALFVCRLILGIGEAPQFPAGAKSIGEWFNIKERGKPTGYFNSSSSIGPALAPPILTVLMVTFGWRWMFVILGVLGILASIGWLAMYRNRDSVELTKQEQQSLDEGSPKGKAGKATIKESIGLLSHTTTWGIIIGFMGVIYMIWLYLTWLPAYLEHEYGLSIAKTGFVVMIPYLFAIAGTITAGYVADYFAKKGFDIIRCRKFQAAISLILAGLFTIPAAYASNATMAVSFICASQFCLTFASGSAWVLVSTVIASRQISFLGGLQNFGGYLAGSFAPIVTGYIVQNTGSFKFALIISSCVAFASALAYIFLVKKPIGE